MEIKLTQKLRRELSWDWELELDRELNRELDRELNWELDWELDRELELELDRELKIIQRTHLELELELDRELKIIQMKSTKEFDKFWNAYGYKVDKFQAFRQFKKLSEANKKLAIEAAPLYNLRCKITNTEMKMAKTYLYQQTFHDDFSEFIFKNEKYRNYRLMIADSCPNLLRDNVYLSEQEFEDLQERKNTPAIQRNFKGFEFANSIWKVHLILNKGFFTRQNYNHVMMQAINDMIKKTCEGHGNWFEKFKK
jgi:hypothetical protein